jgi:hypothetical protein
VSDGVGVGRVELTEGHDDCRVHVLPQILEGLAGTGMV